METLENLSFACIGHRGACGHAPENTLTSFRRAMDMGCPWLELDVYAVEDELIVIHDDTLERTTNGFGDARRSAAPAGGLDSRSAR